MQLLVLLVPVFLGLMGFAVDLGRLYLIRGELTQAAQAMAQQAAGQLIGTDASTDNATTAARLLIETDSGFGNRYNFGAHPIGQTTGFLASEAPDPSYFATAADAIGQGDAAGASVGGSSARYVRVQLTGDAPLLFWGLLPLGQERKTPIAATAVAGISAPLCTACAVEPLAVAALDSGDTTDYGFVLGTRYTLGYQCTGTPVPSGLPGAGQFVPYLLLDHFDDTSSFDENQQVYRIGAQGTPPSQTQSLACIQITTGTATEQLWGLPRGTATANPLPCTQNQVPTVVTPLLCGVASRLEATPPSACSAIAAIDTLSTAYSPDPDVTDLDDYTTYTGNARRVITIAIVDVLSAGGPMNILGFRQFLVEPDQGATNVNPVDPNGRFVVLYIGSVVPVKQGRFDGCSGVQVIGPGKVVLHE